MESSPGSVSALSPARPSPDLRAVLGGRAALGVGKPGKQRENQPRRGVAGTPARGLVPGWGGGAKWGRWGRCRGRGRGQRGGGPLSGRRQNLTAASPAQAAPPGSPPAAKAEHCELVHFAVNFPLLKNTLSHPRERPHLARPGAFRSGSRGVTAQELRMLGCGQGRAAGPFMAALTLERGRAARAAPRAIGLLMRPS